MGPIRPIWSSRRDPLSWPQRDGAAALAASRITHVLRTYGGLPPLRATARGGLAPWQARRAAEMIRESLAGTLHLSDLARECGLSVSHFARGFRKSFGMSPYRWLVERRVDCAKAMLLAGTLPIAEIAGQCGFSDQSTFTRAFARVAGDSPARWKRAVTSRTAPTS